MVYLLANGKMNKLITVVNDEVIEYFRRRDGFTLLYPLQGFCVGYQKYYNIEDIDGFVLINRILNDFDLDLLDDILKSSNISGVVFDDLGIIELVKDLKVTKILLLDHLACNTKSINYYLDYVDSVIVSNDLTKDEIKSIVSNAKKPLVVNVFGLKTLMYSRRLLLSNYQEFYNLKKENILNTSIKDNQFLISENEYGTKFYGKKYYDALELLDLDNVCFFWYDPIFLDVDSILNVVLKSDTKMLETSKYFLDKKTVYKIGDLDG